VNRFIQNPDGSNKLEGAAYYWFFVALMVVTAIIFIFISKSYKEESYIQTREKIVA
jgi:POT family proton-dependent oligopeptide transporter